MYLCIDTATVEAGVSLVSKEKAISYQTLDVKRASEELMETIDELLSSESMMPEDLTGVMVLSGPGSFTGLRVGIAVANQFSHQLKLPIRAVTSDEWYLARSSEEGAYFQSMNRDELYVKVPGSEAAIIEIEVLKKRDSLSWFGQVSELHLSMFPKGFKQKKDLYSPMEGWYQILKKGVEPSKKKYELVTPFYGKDPTITQTKRKLTI